MAVRCAWQSVSPVQMRNHSGDYRANRLHVRRKETGAAPGNASLADPQLKCPEFARAVSRPSPQQTDRHKQRTEKPFATQNTSVSCKWHHYHDHCYHIACLLICCVHKMCFMCYSVALNILHIVECDLYVDFVSVSCKC